MGNEKNTENLARKMLTSLGYYDDSHITVEEQKTENKKIDRLLSSAGGKKKDSKEVVEEVKKKGKARPEFICLHQKDRSYVMVIECKASTSKHKTEGFVDPVNYAVDGVLYYAKALSKEYNVIAVAISGEKESEVIVSNYIWAKGAAQPSELIDKDFGKPFSGMLKFEDYKKHANYDSKVANSKLNDLIDFSQDLHQYIYDVAKLSEAEKPLLVSGLLLALQDKAFRQGYKDIPKKSLGKFLLEAIDRRFSEELKDQEEQVKKIVHEYKFLEYHPNLNKIDSDKKSKETPLEHILDLLNENVYPFIDAYHRIDVLGEFYTEFLSYVGGDKKGLGIVLTPTHVKELFCELAQLTPKDRIADTCMGTAGFLISGMDYMMKLVGKTPEAEQLKKQGFLGIEQEPRMFTLATSNMLLRGFSIKNMHQGSCFSVENRKALREYSPTACLLNPPYSQSGEGLNELDFIYDACENSAKGAKIVAIVPMSCAISSHKTKTKLLENHRLLAVMSMPDELFYPVGTVTCIMVFEAHTPHNSSKEHKTWFGYWKDDGFIKTKVRGRQDFNHKWASIKTKWVESFLNKKEIPEFSVLKKVDASDEWCAEAYLQTDYSKMTEKDFYEFIKKYELFQIQSESLIDDEKEEGNSDEAN